MARKRHDIPPLAAITKTVGVSINRWVLFHLGVSIEYFLSQPNEVWLQTKGESDLTHIV